MSGRTGRALTGLALLALCGAVLAACGGTSLPEPEPCVDPTPTPTPRPERDEAFRGFVYYRTVERGVATLAEELATFRARWPGDTFYRNPDFRPEFVRYAGRAACLIRDLQALPVPQASPRFVEFAARVRPLLAQYAEELEAGREAVRQRNTSKYRAWARATDALAVQLDEAISSAAQ
jgi:hypothetical protein